MCQKRQDPGDLLLMGPVLLAFRLESLPTASKDGWRMPYVFFVLLLSGFMDRRPKELQRTSHLT